MNTQESIHVQVGQVESEPLREAVNESLYGAAGGTLCKEAPGYVEDGITDNNAEILVDKAGGTYSCLDVTRVLCVWLICVDHGGTKFGVWNTMYVQAWVLQYIFIIAGICYGMSSRNLSYYLSRLLFYFCVGVCFNFAAFVFKGMDWKNNIWNVVFQFWFILGLMMFLVLLTPLKTYMAKVRSRVVGPGDQMQSQPQEQGGRGDPLYHLLGRGHFGISLVLLLLGCAFVNILYAYVMIPMCVATFSGIVLKFSLSLGPEAVFWAFPQNLSESGIFVEALMNYFQLSITGVFIVLAYPMLSNRLPMVGWFMMLNTYGHRAFLYRAQEARFVNGFDVTLLGLTCYYYGLAYRRVIGRYMCRYWFVLLFILALLWPPGTYGRYDEHPPKDLGGRIGYNLCEWVMIVLFLCGMERLVDPKIFTEDHCQFLGYWALALFLVHKAVHISVASPFNWLILLGLAPVCYALAPVKKKKESSPEMKLPKSV